LDLYGPKVKQIPHNSLIFAEFKEFLVISGMESSIPILEKLIPVWIENVSMKKPTNFIDQFTANPQAFDAISIVGSGLSVDRTKVQC
jgi:hypothetical protein